MTCDPELQLPEADLPAIGGIIDEAVSNALRHAFPVDRDGDVWVQVREAEGRINLVIRDNGIGISDLQPDPDSGRGRISELARGLGGYARLGSAPFGGGQVSVVFRRNR